MLFSSAQRFTWRPLRGALLLAMLSHALVASDTSIEEAGWANWRGTDCNGATSCGQPLVEDVTEAKLAWQSAERIPGSIGSTPEEGGYGSGYHDPVLAEGKAFHYFWRPAGPVDERLQRSLQWTADLDEKMRENKVRSYIRKAAEDIPNRSRPLADDTIIAWDQANGETLWRADFAGGGLNTGYCTITYGIYSPHLVSCYYDGILVNFSSSGRIRTLRATDGKPLWTGRLSRAADIIEMRLEDFARNRAYFAGGKSRFFGTGAKRDEPGVGGMNSSGIVADGVIAIADFMGETKDCGMVGIDLRTGEHLWQIPGILQDVASMPLRWRHQGKEYIVAVGIKRGICVEPRSGRILWEIKGDPLCAETYPALQGDLLITPGKGSYGRGKGKGTAMTCWKMSLEKAEPVWRATDGPKCKTFTGPVISGDRVYYRGGVVSRDLATGAFLQSAPIKGNPALIMTDDRLFVGPAMFRVAADDKLVEAGTLSYLGRNGKFTFSTDLADWTSAVVSDGRLFYRTTDRLLCWDLLKEPRPVEARAEPPTIADATGALTALNARDLTTRTAGKQWLLANLASAQQVLKDVAAAAMTDEWQRASAAAEVLIALGDQAKPIAAQAATTASAALHAGDAARARLLAWVAISADAGQRPGLATTAAGLVTNEDLLVVQAACAVLGQCGDDAAVAVPALTERIGSGDDRALAFAVEAFTAIGSQGASCVGPLLARINAQPDSVEALFAAQCLDAFPPGTVELNDELLAAFCATDRATRFWISEVLTEIGPSVVQPLVAAAKAHGGKRIDDALVLDVGKTCMNLGTAAKAALPWLESMQSEVSSKDGIQAHAKAWLIYCCDVIAGEPVKLVSRAGKHKEGIALGDAAQAEAFYRAVAAGTFKGKHVPIFFLPPSD